ncbi:MAG: AsmA family protein, partial [Flavobacteriales bacterium]|nr:AsmA family protein [Flavobacteriales bacterium]
MKKFLKITGIVLLVILAILIALPFLFKDKIAEQIRVVANESLNATLDFNDLSISLFSNFPHATVTLEGLTIDGAGNFESVRLAELGSVSATVNIMSLLGETMQIESVSIANGKLDVRVLEDGSANYDIAKADDTETPEPATEEEEGGAFALELQSYELVNLDIEYSDATLPMTASIKTLNHSGSGDFTASKTLLETKTSMARLDVEYDKVKYIRKAVVDMIVNLDLDLENMHFVFAQNEVGINDLKLGIDGSLDMPGDDMAMDITFGAKDANFKSLLSLVPAEFATDLKGVEAAGTMSFNGFVKGGMSETSMPGYGIDIKVKDGRFNYPDLPKSVENIQVDMMVDASDGNNFDATVVDIKRFYMEMADNPVDLRLRLTTPESDPNIDCSVQAKVILDNLADVIPLEEGETISGSINADLALKGRMSTIEQEKYEEFDAAGQVILQQVAFRSSAFMYPMDVDVAYLEFTPKALKLNQFEGRIGQSDLQAQGQMDNYLAFALRDELLHGNFSMTSSLLDLNELMGPETEG